MQYTQPLQLFVFTDWNVAICIPGVAIRERMYIVTLNASILIGKLDEGEANDYIT